MSIPYIQAAKELLERLERTQENSIRQAAQVMADAIAAGGFAHFFGAGHSHMALEEAFPRTGGLVGLHPMTELALSYYTPVVGNSGIEQMKFYQEVQGLGEIIWRNYRFKPTDCFVVFTNTGITKVAIDIARLAKAHGHRVIGVTSMDHATTTGTDHPLGQHLHEVADIVIDNCAPAGDAMIPVPGSEDRCGAGSTIGVVAVVNALATETAAELTRRGVKPMILASNYFEGDEAENTRRREHARENWRRCLNEFRARYQDMLGPFPFAE
ncbi:MAG: SIS domain-containing protein [Ktedonobacteraceae bacterium]|nr:SIS domain-containing protein [Ktedonobacteraceae bacterium]